MFRLSLAGLALFISLVAGYGQKINRADTSYKPKALKIEEVNIVSSYYAQRGNHSAVTGGIGSEQLTDQANTFELKLLKQNRSGVAHHFLFGIGFDSYTSASSDKIDTATTWNGFNTPVTSIQEPGRNRHRSGASSISTTTTVTNIGGQQAVTTASYRDNRIYPSINWSTENSKTGWSIGAGLSFSTEYDYYSKGATVSIGKTSKNKNSDISLNLGAFLDTWLVIYPAELRPINYPYGSERDVDLLTRSPRNSFNAGLTWSQVISKKLQIGLMVEPSYQEGLLATKYQRVYFANGIAQPENLPDNRSKLPISIRASYFIGDHIVFRPYYRYYQDTWGLEAHTVQLETAIKLSPHVSLSPFYRYYHQNGVPYFAPYKLHQSGEEFFTSDYDLSPLQSHQMGMGIRLVPTSGIFGIRAFNSLECRFAHYERSSDLKSNIITFALTFK